MFLGYKISQQFRGLQFIMHLCYFPPYKIIIIIIIIIPFINIHLLP
jgi:hypothetical protein